MSKEAERIVKFVDDFIIRKTKDMDFDEQISFINSNEYDVELLQSFADEQNKELREAVEGIKEVAKYSKSWSKINKDEMRGAIYVSNLVLDKIKELEL